MNLTVGIGTHHRPRRLDDLLDGLHDQSRPPDEVVLVYSGDAETAEVIRDHRDRFEDAGVDLDRLSKRPDTDCVQAIRNRIVGVSDGDAVCFLDDDTVPTDGWLEAIQSTYEDGHDVAGVGGPAIRADRTLEPTDDIVRTAEKLNRVTKYGEVVDASGCWIPPHPVDVDVCRGANMSFGREVLEDIGGFDVGYGGKGSFEEWDAMVRARARGGRIVYHPDALVYHLESRTGGTRRARTDDRPETYWFARNSIRFRRKNYPDTYGRSLLRLLVASGGEAPPVLKRVALLPTAGGRRHANWLRGYLDGVLGRGGD